MGPSKGQECVQMKRNDVVISTSEKALKRLLSHVYYIKHNCTEVCDNLNKLTDVW